MDTAVAISSAKLATRNSVPAGELSRVRCPAAQRVQELLEGVAGVREADGSDDLRPMQLDIGDAVAGVIQRLPATWRGEDEFGALVGAVRPAFQVSKLL